MTMTATTRKLRVVADEGPRPSATLCYVSAEDYARYWKGVGNPGATYPAVPRRRLVQLDLPFEDDPCITPTS